MPPARCVGKGAQVAVEAADASCPQERRSVNRDLVLCETKPEEEDRGLDDACGATVACDASIRPVNHG